MTHSTWVYVIDGYGHRIPLLGPWTASIGPALTGIGACMVQIFLARRILNLSKMSWKGITIAVVITLLALTQGILSLVVTTKFLKAYHDFQQLRNAIHITQVSLAVALVCDAIITFSTVTLLWRTKDTITGALNITLNKFLIKSVETGAVITVAASISLFFFVRYPLSLRAMIV
ncbi:hypothetical protein AX16_003946 [Volvariella volvacea WC 439]|nr:hypothetical protein AX16_003946 [Volvariella volvacea WC 439]